MTTVNTDPEIIKRVLDKGVEQVLPSKEALKELLESGKQIKLYQGFDPTGPTLHIGHTALLHKLEDFRLLGHKVYIVIGDFTARIGDPDKKSARQVLTKEQVEENLKTYKEQIGKILDINNKENPVEFRFNSEWLEPLRFADIINLASNFSVQQMLKRDMFQKRIEDDKPIYIHEFMYPIMQGFDSVNLDVDLEIGGNDQMFNMLTGRDLMRILKNKEKLVLTGKLLTDNSGEKMGKTTGNMIRMDESPNDIYGKVMAFSDGMILNGFEILTFATLPELEQYKNRLDAGENPINLKKELALKITSELKSEEEAILAQKYFEEVYQNKTFDTDITEVTLKEKEIKLIDLIVKTGLAQSNGQARRLIEQGAVKIDDEKQESWDSNISINKPILLKVGKKICRIILTS